MVVMESGRAQISGSFDELTAQFWPEAVVVLEAESPDQLDRIATWHGVLNYEREPAVPGAGPDAAGVGTARVELDGFGRIPDLVTSLVRDGVRLRRVEPRVASVEDLYFAIRRDASGSASHLAPVSAPGVSGEGPQHPVADGPIPAYASTEQGAS